MMSLTILSPELTSQWKLTGSPAFMVRFLVSFMERFLVSEVPGPVPEVWESRQTLSTTRLVLIVQEIRRSGDQEIRRAGRHSALPDSSSSFRIQYVLIQDHSGSFRIQYQLGDSHPQAGEDK